MRIEEQHPDVLQNIEHAVAAQFRRHPEMTDYSVMRTYEALIDLYAAEKAGRSPRVTERAGVESDLFDDARHMCEWRLGRGTLDDQGTMKPPTAIDTDTLLLCLKRLLSSVKKWNKHGGRQGYLNFMSQFVK